MKSLAILLFVTLGLLSGCAQQITKGQLNTHMLRQSDLILNEMEPFFKCFGAPEKNLKNDINGIFSNCIGDISHSMPSSMNRSTAEKYGTMVGDCTDRKFYIKYKDILKLSQLSGQDLDNCVSYKKLMDKVISQ